MKSGVKTFSLCTDVPPPSEKMGRGGVCKSPSLIVFRYTFAYFFFFVLSLTVEKVLTEQDDSDSFRARTQLFSRMFSTFVAKLGSNYNI